jgi:hypothetical protein
VHPSMLANTGSNTASRNERPENGGASTPGPIKNISTFGIEVRSNRSVLPNHFWIGVNGAAESPTAA